MGYLGISKTQASAACGETCMHTAPAMTISTLRDSLQKTERVFGVPLKDAKKIERKKALAEGLQRIKTFEHKAEDLICHKYFLVSEDYKKVQLKALVKGGVFLSPAYWVTLALLQLGWGTGALLLKSNLESFSSHFVTFTIDMSFATIVMFFASRKLVKELRKNGEED